MNCHPITNVTCVTLRVSSTCITPTEELKDATASILYSHCFPASHRPEAWFPQRPKPSTLNFAPTEDAAAHLSVNPATNPHVTFTQVS